MPAVLPLEYGKRPPRWPRRRRIAKWAAGGLIALFIVALVPWPARERVIRMDAITGSTTTTTSTKWFGVTLSSATAVQTSPLERRLQSMNVAWTPTSDLIHRYYDTWLGGRGVGCGRAPEIYDLRPVQADFVAASTGDEIRAFVNVLQTGTPQQQRDAVLAAGEKGLEAMAARP